MLIIHLMVLLSLISIVTFEFISFVGQCSSVLWHDIYQYAVIRSTRALAIT